MPQSAHSFHAILRAALHDIGQHGYDSEQRIEFWVDQLRAALFKALTPVHKMRELLRGALSKIYHKAVERGDLVQEHHGVGKFTLDKVKPQLRAELDRRILASANLIKDNRENAVRDTLARFRGWSTSITAGGSRATNKRRQALDIRKSMNSLPYRERRVLIDQGHKLRASLSEILAKDGGAIAMIWHSRWRQPNYNYREDHKERDLNVYLLRDSWAHERGLAKPGDAGYYDEVTSVGEEVNCRCYAQWLYSVRALPVAMLTAKGKAELERVRIADSESYADEFKEELHPRIPRGPKGEKIDTKHDIPLIAGTSKSGGTIYEDKRIPRWVMVKGKRADAHKILAAHESAEDEGIRAGEPYHHAHVHRGIPAEKAECKRQGIDWEGWNEVIGGYASRIEHQRNPKLPHDLEKAPYRESGRGAID